MSELRKTLETIQTDMVGMVVTSTRALRSASWAITMLDNCELDKLHEALLDLTKTISNFSDAFERLQVDTVDILGGDE